MRKNYLRKCFAVTAGIACMATSFTPVSTWAANVSVDVNTSTFKNDTDTSSEFIVWKSNVWQGGEGQFADSAKIALAPGKCSKDLNFAWYSESTGEPAVKVWKKGSTEANIVYGVATAISASNWQGKTYLTSNKVNIVDYFEEGCEYVYQYTDNYLGDGTKWSDEYKYACQKSDSYSVILTGDPQVGASGSSDDNSATDSSVARDTFNWNKTMTKALEICPDAAFLLSAGDQIDKSGATSVDDLKTRESEYAGYLYPSVFRSLPIASTIGNHDMNGVDYSQHFNNPNSQDNLGATNAGSDYYFSYGDVLYISLNSNNRNQEEHRALMNKAVQSNPDAKWKIVIFHSDIYGSGQPHADTDAVQNRIILAPLMDEFGIDVVLTGHDHTYSRSYQILDGNVIDYDISSGSVTNPEGTLYITTGSGSGSKYYNLLNYTPYYIADRCNTCLPAFSTIDFSSGSLTIKTYDYNGDKYAEDFTINKTEATVETTIKKAEELLASKGSYTEESLAKLDSVLAVLKAANEAYTKALSDNKTANDPMVANICNSYNTAADVISGYGSVKNAGDKDGSINRFKKGMSTILDKTVYSQVAEGTQAALAGFDSLTAENKPQLPVVDAVALQQAVDDVNSAIDALVVCEQKGNDEAVVDDNASDIPKTGDTSNILLMVASMFVSMLAIVATGFFRKRKENC